MDRFASPRTTGNKALLSIITMMFDFFNSKTGILLLILISSVKVVFIFYGLFVSAYDTCGGNLKLVLYFSLCLNVMSVVLNTLRMNSFNRPASIVNTEGSLMYGEAVMIITIIQLPVVLAVPIILTSIGKDADYLQTLISILVYTTAFDHCIVFLTTLFSIVYILIATTLKRSKKSFILKKTESNSKAFVCCPICLENYQDGEYVMVLYCEHNFHYECVSIWLDFNSNCPVCKKDLDMAITLYENSKLKL